MDDFDIAAHNMVVSIMQRKKAADHIRAAILDVLNDPCDYAYSLYCAAVVGTPAERDERVKAAQIAFCDRVEQRIKELDWMLK